MGAKRILYEYVESRMQTAHQSVAFVEWSKEYVSEVERIVDMSVAPESDWT